MTQRASGASGWSISERCSRNCPPSAHSNVVIARISPGGASDVSTRHWPTRGLSLSIRRIFADRARSALADGHDLEARDDIGGAYGLIHRLQLADTEPRLGQEVEVEVLAARAGTGSVSLGQLAA
jgi:hypothetical protein